MRADFSLLGLVLALAGCAGDIAQQYTPTGSTIPRRHPTSADKPSSMSKDQVNALRGQPPNVQQ